MLNILDRYIIAEYIKPVFASLVLIVGILLISRIMDDIHWALKEGTFELAVVYWAYHIPEFMTGILPMALLFATSYTIGNFNKNSELVALMVGGISFFRMTLPILILGFLFSIASFVLSDTLVIYSTEKIKLYKCYIKDYPDREKCDARFNQSQNRRNVKLRNPTGEKKEFFISAEEFLFHERELINIDVYFMHKGKIKYRILAQKARQEGDKWIFFKGFVAHFSSPGRISSIETFDREFFPIQLKRKQIILKAQKLNIQRVRGNTMSAAETLEYIEDLKQAGKPYRLQWVEFHAKFSMAFMAFILTFLGAALGSRLQRSVMALAFGQSLLLAFFYIVFLQLGKIIGREGLLPPFLAAWAGNILFLLVGIYLFRKSRF